MGHYQELPKLVHPDFAVPNRKPVGAVEIDWSNPLTKGLKICYVPASGLPINLAAIKPMASDSPLPLGINRNKQCLVYSTDGSRVYNPVKTDVYLNHGDHTFLCEWRSDVVSASYSPFVFSNTHSSNTGIVFNIYGFNGISPNQMGSLKIIYSGVAAYPESADFEVNKDWLSIGFSGTANSDYDYVLDGQFIGNTTVGTLTASPTPIWLYGYGRSSIGMVGAAGYSYYWERRLTEVECKAIADNPYQILKPVNPITYFIPSAGGGGATVIPPTLHSIDNQFASITAHRLGGVLQ